MFWAEVNSSLLMKMEAVFRDTGKGMLRRPNKTGQIKGLKSHRASKGNRDNKLMGPVPSRKALQADTQSDSEYKL